MRIKAQNISFKYGAQNLLEEVNLDADVGEFVALLGPNGCGKTTLLKNLSGLLFPQTGKVLLDGKSLLDWSHKERTRSLAFLEQHIQVDFDFCIRELVSFGRQPHLEPLQPMQSKDREVIEKAMEQTDVLKFAERSIFTLSSGERQRVWLAMALAQTPRILLLDEPTSHLDLRYQMDFFRLLKELTQQEGLTIIVATHQLQLISLFADKIIAMKEGKVVASGSPKQVLTAKNIQEVFEVLVQVITDPSSQEILGVIPLQRNGFKR